MTTDVKGKNRSIEFLRFFFMLFICLSHFPGRTVIHLNHAYLAVDFFFIVSGLFIYRSSTKDAPPSTFDYTLKKVKRFWPKMVVGCALLLFCNQPGFTQGPLKKSFWNGRTSLMSCAL